VEASLRAKGFRENAKADHRVFTYFTQEGLKSVVFTKTSHGSGYRTLDDGLLGQMARQCRLTKARFIELVDCPLSQDDYEKELQAGGHL